jgi:hypothetical protein
MQLRKSTGEFGFRVKEPHAGVAAGDIIICVDPWADGLTPSPGDLLIVENQMLERGLRVLAKGDALIRNDGYFSLRLHLDDTAELRVVGVVIRVLRDRVQRFSKVLSS